MAQMLTKSEGTRTMRSSKSRTGCATCKQKRLKCDETKPHCSNCTSRQLECPGYQILFKWHIKCQRDVTGNGRGSKKRKLKEQESFTNDGESLEEADREADATGTSGARATAPKESVEVSEAKVTEESSETSYESQLNDPDPLQDPGDVNEVNLNEVMALCNDSTLDNILKSSYGSPIEQADNISILSYDFSCGQQRSNGSSIFSHDSLGSSRATSNSIGYPTVPRKPSRDVHTLLGNFYKSSPTLTRPLMLESTRLVEYYFSRICGIISCFDSPLNSFRYFSKEVWDRSASTYYAIQSMAAAHIANEIAYMKKEGLRLFRTASEFLRQELTLAHAKQSNDTAPLLSLLLLGISASWHKTTDTGDTYLLTARQLLSSNLAMFKHKYHIINHPLLSFFEEATIYWEMVASLVSSEPYIVYPYQDAQSRHYEAPTPKTNAFSRDGHELVQMPHPWTGVSAQSQILLAEVGRLVRRTRIARQSLETLDSVSHLALAFELEEKLLSTSPPAPNTIADCGDMYTRDVDFTTLARVTIDCSLLLLYRHFPDLWARRTSTDAEMESDFVNDSSIEQPKDAWLTMFAIRVLRRLETIPNTSGIRAHQLLPLLITASELHFPTRTTNSDFDPCNDFVIDMEIHWARRFARARLSSLAIQLAAKRVNVVTDLVKETWRLLDEARVVGGDRDRENSVLWMDVMEDKGWYTMLG